MASSRSMRSLRVIVAAGAFVTIAFMGCSKDQGAKTPGTLTKESAPKAFAIDTAALKFDTDAVTADPFSDRNGPFFHDLFMASSADGLQFSDTKLIMEKASVPDAVRLDSGQIVIYAVDGARRSKSGFLVAVSADDGNTWKAGSAQLESDRGNQIAAADPEVVIEADGKMRLYYLSFDPHSKPAPPGEPVGEASSENKIYSATSSDGINFVEEEGTRFQYPRITDPDVVKIGDQWFMYSSVGRELIYATSKDARNFAYAGVIRQEGSVSKTVSIGNDTWRQYYCGAGIQSATSSDGIAWTDEPGTRVEALAGDIVCDPAPVNLGESWLMIYKVAHPAINPG